MKRSNTTMRDSPVILIAEDEENVSLALESILIKSFLCNIIIAKDGQSAWEKILSNHIDLIISDWNMPNKSGDQLLLDVRSNEKVSDTPFIMLTARSDKESVVSALMSGVSSYISKPFNKKDVIDKVQQYLDFSGNIDTKNSCVDKTNNIRDKNNLDQAIDDFLDNPNFVVPVLPDIANEVIAMLPDKNANADKLAATINKDSSLTAKLISISNSVIFMGSKVITNLQDAVVRLGLEETKNYAMMYLQKDMLSTHDPIFKKIIDSYWQHSFATAICARHIALHLELQQRETYFTIGLIHDIGKLLLLKILIEFTKSGDQYDEETVHNILSSKHENVGAFLLKRWGFPSNIIEAVSNHHNILKGAHNSTTELVINLADTLVRKMGYSTTEDSEIELSEIISAKTLMISTKELNNISDAIEEQIEKMTTAMPNIS